MFSSIRHGYVVVGHLCLQIFAGLLVNLDTLSDTFKWMKYVSLFRYSTEVNS